MAFAPPPPPKTALGHYRLLSPTAAVRVSPLCLGAMNFGDAWKGFMGECGKETTEEILDYFYGTSQLPPFFPQLPTPITESGGNFIDTANNYQSVSQTFSKYNPQIGKF